MFRSYAATAEKGVPVREQYDSAGSEQGFVKEVSVPDLTGSTGDLS